MDVRNRYKTSLFEEFIFLGDLILYCCRVGGLDESVRDEVDIRIGKKY